jgi:hypothetical protein
VERTRLSTTCAVFVALAAAGLPAGAHAQEPTCRPSEEVAALDQYCDFLPTPDGDEQPVNLAADPTPQTPVSRALPMRHVAELQRSGPEARALLLLPVVAPVHPTPEQRRRMRTTRREALGSTTLDSPDATPRTVISGVTEGVTAAGERALGGAFQWVLLVCTVGFAGMAWLRFRARLKL